MARDCGETDAANLQRHLSFTLFDMTSRIEFRLPLFESDTLTDHDRGYLKGIHPLADGSAVVHLSTYTEGEFETSLIHVGDGFRRPLPVPDAIRACVSRCRKDEVTEAASYGAPISFRVRERVGLLIADRWAWIFAPDGNTPPVAIEIAPLPLAACITAKRSYIPVHSGVSHDGSIPIILRHPDARPDYPAYLAMLEFDLDAGTAQWNARALSDAPATVPYRVDPEGLNGVPEYAGSSLGDAVQLGDRLRVFTMGNNTHYGRMGMQHPSALETSIDGSSPRCLREINESSHGLFSPDGRHMLLLPFFKSGPRKGKPSLVDLDSGEETALHVRGLAAYRPLAYRDGWIWFAGKGDWADWSSLVLSESKHGELVACRID